MTSWKRARNGGTCRLLVWSCLLLSSATPAQTEIRVPIGQITRLHGSVPVELTGLGLITGLNGTGAGDKGSRQAAENLVRTFGLNVREGDLTSGSFALVTVNAVLPAFAKEGQKLDVKVSTLSDATSLFGGYLQETFLLGPDRQTRFAVARGPITVHGWSASSQGTSVVRNHVTTADVPSGAEVIRAVESSFLSEEGNVELQLINPNLQTAANIATAMTESLQGTGCAARAVDPTLVQILLPQQLQTEDDAIRLLNLIRPLRVLVQNPAVVVIDAASGSVVAGEGVMICPCVVTLSDLTISVVSEDEVSQPLPGLNLGTTEVVKRTRIDVATSNSKPAPLSGGASVAELLGNLRALELSPRQLIHVFERLASEGFLQAPLIVK